MSRTTIVNHPDGTTSRRKSASAIYTHAVVVGPADPAAYADRLDRDAAAADQRAVKLIAALGTPKVTVRNRGLSRNGDPDVNYRGEHTYHGYMAALAGTNLDTHCDSQGMTETVGEYRDDGSYQSYGNDVRVVPARESLIAAAKAHLVGYRRAAEGYRATAARIRAGDEQVPDTYTGWTVVRWSSRRDLAEKAADSEGRHHREHGRPVTVVAVQEA